LGDSAIPTSSATRVIEALPGAAQAEFSSAFLSEDLAETAASVPSAELAFCRRHPFGRPVLGFAAFLIFISIPGLASAQDISVNFGDSTTLTQRAIQLIALMTVLSLAPSILVMVTSFTRIIVVLSLLRTAIGLQTAPPNSVMVSLALFLTAFIMAPTLQQSYDQGIAPLMAGQIQVNEAFTRSAAPIHKFMMANVRQEDLKLFYDLSNAPAPTDPTTVPLQLLVPAFMISELRRAFEIGFMLFVPFVVIDMVVASVLMSMGMMMLPPVIISLPFKLIFFVLVNGWDLVAGSLVRSFVSG
jgi:flagellar biosynthetic protein FliP